MADHPFRPQPLDLQHQPMRCPPCDLPARPGGCSGVTVFVKPGQAQFVDRGPPDRIRSDNDPEFVAKEVRGWLGRVGVKTLFMEPGSPSENGYNERFNGKLRDELLDWESSIRRAKLRS